ncbi:MAG: MoaD/ThiS family protein [Chthoniobacterales bacterium]
MKVRVQFFSHLKELAAASELELEMPPDASTGDLLEELYQRTPALRAWDQSILIGAGVEFVRRDHVLQPNEEIAIMPPVQGG